MHRNSSSETDAVLTGYIVLSVQMTLTVYCTSVFKDACNSATVQDELAAKQGFWMGWNEARESKHFDLTGPTWGNPARESTGAHQAAGCHSAFGSRSIKHVTFLHGPARVKCGHGFQKQPRCCIMY